MVDDDHAELLRELDARECLVCYGSGKVQRSSFSTPRKVIEESCSVCRARGKLGTELEWRAASAIRALVRERDEALQLAEGPSTLKDLAAMSFERGLECERLRGDLAAARAECERLRETRDEDNPCAQALDDLWKRVILSGKPDYGDWEYPAQAYRHLVAEFDGLRAKAGALDALEKWLRKDERGFARVELNDGRIRACLMRLPMCVELHADTLAAASLGALEKARQ